MDAIFWNDLCGGLAINSLLLMCLWIALVDGKNWK